MTKPKKFDAVKLDSKGYMNQWLDGVFGQSGQRKREHLSEHSNAVVTRVCR